MQFALCSILVALLQAPPTSSNPWGQPNNKLVPGQGQPPVKPHDPGGQTGASFPIKFGPLHQMTVDGTYQVLAYEKFGQMLPGMNTIKVVIRQNILYFPGDTKTPGKMMRLTFGSNNSIMITPLDGKGDPNPPGNTLPPVVNSRQAGQPPPDKNQRDTTGQNIHQAGFVPPSTNSEWGVYVISGEFFSIAVIGKWPILHETPANQTPPITPGNPVTSRKDPLTSGSSNDASGQQKTVNNAPGGSIMPKPPGPSDHGTSRTTIVLRRVAN